MEFTLKGIVGLIVATAFGLALSVWAPFWPTEPEFQPTSISASNPMDIPFSVRNRSTIFDISRLQIKCGIIEARTEHNSGVEQLSVVVSGTNKLGALSVDYYVCPLSRVVRFPPESKIVSAKVQFLFSYYPFGRADNAPSTGESKIFTANGSPLQWVEGEGLH